MILEQRRVATESVMARFRDRPFSWTGRRTCLHLARAQMTAMGHRPPAIPDLRSARSARAALAKRGHDDLMQLLDSMLPRIAPASMWLGDLALMEGGDFDALVVNVGDKVIGYHDDDLRRGLVVIEPVGEQPFKAAWRL